MDDLEQARSELSGKFSKREIEIVEHITMEALKQATLVERARILAWCEKNQFLAMGFGAEYPAVWLGELQKYLGVKNDKS